MNTVWYLVSLRSKLLWWRWLIDVSEHYCPTVESKRHEDTLSNDKQRRFTGMFPSTPTLMPLSSSDWIATAEKMREGTPARQGWGSVKMTPELHSMRKKKNWRSFQRFLPNTCDLKNMTHNQKRRSGQVLFSTTKQNTLNSLGVGVLTCQEALTAHYCHDFLPRCVWGAVWSNQGSSMRACCCDLCASLS